MFIVIEDDIFDEFEKIDNSFELKVRAIDELFDGAMYKGKHIVYSKIKNLETIKNNKHVAPRTRKYVSWIIKEYTMIYSCRSIIKKYISISTKYVEINCKDDCYELPLEFFLDINATKLLTEHESDADFYQQLAVYIYKKNKMSNFYSICFENDSYHGSNGGAKIKQVSEDKRCVLCIVDTDMDYPDDEKKDTYNGVSKAVKKAKKKIAIELLVLPVREKENLFPAKIYCLFSDSDIIRIICDKFSSDEVIANFFDIKEGIKYKKILSHDEKWIKCYGELLKECKRRKICNINLTENDLDEYYINGIGDKICCGVANALFVWNSKLIRQNFNNVSAEQAKSIEKNREDILGDIPGFVLHNWELIAEALFNWGCCINKRIYPAQRDW